MKKEYLIEIINQQLQPLGFKKNGTRWTTENLYLYKIVQLEKSNFGNSYYINFGILLKSLDTKGLNMHIFNRLTSKDIIARNEIINLLTADSNIPENEGGVLLKKYINRNIIQYFENINTEDDVKKSIGKWTSPDTIPLMVKKYFDID